MIGRPPLGATETNLIGETMTKFTKKQQQILEDVIHFDGKRVNILNKFTEGFLLWDVVGNVCGNVWGNVEGSVRGSVEGNVGGSVGGSVLGSVLGHVKGSVEGNVEGNVGGNVKGNVKGYVGGNVKGYVGGDVLGNVGGDVLGNVLGYVWGDVEGSVEGSVGDYVKEIKEKTDLTKNTTPFHFLCAEDQERIRSWPHGICVFNFSENKWQEGVSLRYLGDEYVYRTSPAPTETTQTIDGMEFKITYEEGGTNPKIERKESK